MNIMKITIDPADVSIIEHDGFYISRVRYRGARFELRPKLVAMIGTWTEHDSPKHIAAIERADIRAAAMALQQQIPSMSAHELMALHAVAEVQDDVDQD